jgi:hypothetical protein
MICAVDSGSGCSILQPPYANSSLIILHLRASCRPSTFIMSSVLSCCRIGTVGCCHVYAANQYNGLLTCSVSLETCCSIAPTIFACNHSKTSDACPDQTSFREALSKVLPQALEGELRCDFVLDCVGWPPEGIKMCAPDHDHPQPSRSSTLPHSLQPAHSRLLP